MSECLGCRNPYTTMPECTICREQYQDWDDGGWVTVGEPINDEGIIKCPVCYSSLWECECGLWEEDSE